MSDAPSVVSVWKAQCAAGVGALFFWMLVGAFVANGWILLALLMLPLALAGVLLLLVYGPIHADADGLWMEGSLESVGMAWSEIKQIRFGRCQLVLEGEGKRVVLPKPYFWTGPGAAKVLDYIKMLARDYCAEPPKSHVADLVISRNAARIGPQTLK